MNFLDLDIHKQKEFLFVCLQDSEVVIQFLWKSEEGMQSPGTRDLELQKIMSHLWVLGTEPRSFARATRAINC